MASCIGLLVKEVSAGKFVVLLDHVCIGLLVEEVGAGEIVILLNHVCHLLS